MPTGDTGAAQFALANPTWDGRGVTIGIVDTGVSLDHPSLTTTSTGERKVDRLGHRHASDQRRRPDLGRHGRTRSAAAASSSAASRTPRLRAAATASASSTSAIRTWAARSGNDVNRDGNPAGSSGIFAVLWDASANQVWVDTDQDNSFADQTAMTDYKVNFDVSYFGTDNPATAVAERMPFVVQTDGKNKFVNIGIVSAQHGSHVAGIAAGEQPLRRRDERRRSRREDRLLARLSLRRGLHGARACSTA